MLIGYGRVSTADQNPDHQIDALRRAGVDETNIHIDTASGAKASRPKLDLVLTIARAGDTIVMTRLDRLGRSVLHLVTLGAQLRGDNIGLKVIEQGIDTDTAEGRAMFGMLSVLAELQRELIVANTRDGLAAARARGKVGGRRPKLTGHQIEQAQRLYDEGNHTVAQIAGILGVKRGTLYGHLDKASVGTRPRARTNPPPTPGTDTTAPTAPQPRPEPVGVATLTNTADTPAAAELGQHAEPAKPVPHSDIERTPARVDPATVTTERDSASGTHRVLAAGVPIGRIAREHRLRAARWQAYDDTNHCIPRGPFDTVADAVVGLLAYLEDHAAAQREPGRRTQPSPASAPTNTDTLPGVELVHPDGPANPLPHSDIEAEPARREPRNVAWALKQTATRNLPSKPATCPTCGNSPDSEDERRTLRQDIKIVWLESDPHHPDAPREVRHCAQCQPRQQLAAIDCALCDDSGPLLVGDLADELNEFDTVPPPVVAWLTARRWRNLPGHGLICPDHPGVE